MKKTNPSPPTEPPLPEIPEPPAGEPPGHRWQQWLFGKPLDLTDPGLFHRISLIPLLAWVGLGADGLSSSSYGPEEAFRTLGEHTYLALVLAVAVAGTIFIISYAYAHIIEHFPYGGGGYVVATKLLGERAGVVSGCALLVDYILTITVSISAAGDALFSLVPVGWHTWKLPIEIALIVLLTIVNIRGVKESILILLPIFVLFLATHGVLILASLWLHLPQIPGLATEVRQGFAHGSATLGLGGMALLLLHAYSLGGGTYTGLETVSNGLTIMREPRQRTAKRTMLYMALSLAFCAAGLLLCYLLLGVSHAEGKTLNAVLTEQLVGPSGWGRAFLIATLAAEGGLLVVAAQAGLIAGPRVLANMAVDNWVPRRFAALSDRLTTRNGITLMCVGSLAAVLYTRGDVRHLVVMYSINVFLTFSLSMFGMLRMFWKRRGGATAWRGPVTLFATGFLLCATILIITTIEKFTEGGWVTLVTTLLVILLCFAIRRHYREVGRELARATEIFEQTAPPPPSSPPPPPDPTAPTAVVMVGNFGGAGIHVVYSILRMFPHYFKNMVFLSVGVLDSGKFKGHAEIEALRRSAEQALERYKGLAQALGLAADGRIALGTELVDESEKLCREVARQYPKSVFFAGKVIFRNENWTTHLLHNSAAFAMQKRLHWAGIPMVILPMRLGIERQ